MKVLTMFSLHKLWGFCCWWCFIPGHSPRSSSSGHYSTNSSSFYANKWLCTASTIQPLHSTSQPAQFPTGTGTSSCLMRFCRVQVRVNKWTLAKRRRRKQIWKVCFYNFFAVLSLPSCRVSLLILRDWREKK